MKNKLISILFYLCAHVALQASQKPKTKIPDVLQAQYSRLLKRLNAAGQPDVSLQNQARDLIGRLAPFDAAAEIKALQERLPQLETVRQEIEYLLEEEAPEIVAKPITIIKNKNLYPKKKQRPADYLPISVQMNLATIGKEKKKNESCQLPSKTEQDLFAAVLRKEVAEVRRLLSLKPIPNINGLWKANIPPYGESQGTLLMLAIFINAPEIAELLLNHGADVTISNDDGYTALHRAVTQFKRDSSKLPLIRKLLQAGANVNERATGGSDVGLTPLMLAQFWSDPEMMRLLLYEGKDVNLDVKDLRGWTLEDWINKGFFVKFLSQARENQAKIKEIIAQYRQHQLEAAKKEIAKQPEFILPLAHMVSEYLFAPPTFKEEEKEKEEKEKVAEETYIPAENVAPALDLSALANNQLLAALKMKVTTAKYIEDLLEQGARLNAQDSLGYTPLMIAVIYHRPDMVDLFLSYIQEQPNKQELLDMVDKNGDTALAWALRLKKNDLVAKLLRAGASKRS